jgi:hypothetical protein
MSNGHFLHSQRTTWLLTTIHPLDEFWPLGPLLFKVVGQLNLLVDQKTLVASSSKKL